MKSHLLKTAIIVSTVTAYCLLGMACKTDNSPESSLRLRYTFDNQTGDSVSANTGNQTGTLMNGAITAQQNGIPVLSLPAAGEPYFDMGQSAAQIINDSDEYTVAVYSFVPTGTTASDDGRAVWTFSHADTYANGPDASISSLHFRTSRQLEVNVAGQGNARTWPTSADARAAYGRWQHFIVTHNKNIVAFYIDGNRIFTTGATTAAGQITTLSRAWIGRGRWPAVDFMNGGKYADFRIYNKALTREEIDELGIDAMLENLNGELGLYNHKVSSLENAEGVILREDFARFSPANSKPAARLPWFSGIPQTLEVRENDERQCLYLETEETPAEKRRGIIISENISCKSEMVIEALVKPVGGVGGIIELFLIGDNDKTMSFALRAGNSGSERKVIVSAGDAVTNPLINTMFLFDYWYYLHIQLHKDKTVMALLNPDRKIIWKHTFAVAASQLFDSFDIALGQAPVSSGEGTSYMKAYVDYILAADMAPNNIEDISRIRVLNNDQTNKYFMEQVAAVGVPRRDEVRLERSTPEAEGVSSRAILNFMNRVRDENHMMHSVMIVKSGKVIFERWWEPFAPHYRHMLASLTKSFTSIAVGMAVDEGRLTVDTTLGDIFTEEFAQLGSRQDVKIDDRVKSMTIRNLLTMSTGDIKYEYRENRILSFLSGTVTEDPGQTFLYDGDATEMLSAAITRLTGETLAEYLDPRLFIPLGIDRDWAKDEKTDVTYGSAGLSVTTEDLAKFGQLLLQKGMWEGKRLVSEKWIEEATSKQISNADSSAGAGSDWGMGYGYKFWMCKPEGVFRGDGAGGQACVVIPSGDMVIAITEYNNNLERILDLLWEMLDEMKKPVVDRKAAEELAAYKTASWLTTDKEAEEYPGLLTVEYELYQKVPYWNDLASIRFDFRGNECVMAFIREDGTPGSLFFFVNGQWEKAAALDWDYGKVITNGVWKDNTFTATIWYVEAMSVSQQFRFTFRDDFAVVLAERRFGETGTFSYLGRGKLKN